MISNAAFTSVWSNTTITTPCKVNTETREIFDIEIVDVNTDNMILEREYVTVNGVKYPAYSAYTDDEDWDEDMDYWYR